MPSHKAGYGALSHTRSYNFARQLHMKINESASFQSCYLRESCGTDINQEAVETFKDGGGGRQQKKKTKTNLRKQSAGSTGDLGVDVG